MNPTLKIWKRLGNTALGKWLFSKVLCLKAPYFGSIKPRILELRPGQCQVRIKKRRAVQNHLGTVHAIAMCNMAELAGGMMTDVSIPLSHRWIPVGMTVRYLKKAASDLTATAKPAASMDFDEDGEFPVDVVVRDESNQMVFEAKITMRVSKNPT